MIEHRGLKVYRTYKEDDYDQGTRHYSFTVNVECGELGGRCGEEPCRHVFDVRELSTWQAPAHPPYCTGAHDTPDNHAAWEQYWAQEQQSICAAIKAAIEGGGITSSGWLKPAENNAPTGSSIPGKGSE
jgi:hypothetical protein